MAHHSKRGRANSSTLQISRCTTTLGNRCAPKRRGGSVTPAQDDGRETWHLGCCSIPVCGYLNHATRRRTRFCGNKSRRASAERAVLIASSQRKERVESLSRQVRLKSWIEPFRGVMQKPPISILNVWSIGGVRYPALYRLEGRNTFFKVSRGLC